MNIAQGLPPYQLEVPDPSIAADALAQLGMTTWDGAYRTDGIYGVNGPDGNLGTHGTNAMDATIPHTVPEPLATDSQSGIMDGTGLGRNLSSDTKSTNINKHNYFSHLDDIVKDPGRLIHVDPSDFYLYLKSKGYGPMPLSRGSTAGLSFEQGGGFKINWGGDRILQYHPGGGVHKGSYWKVSSGITGIVKVPLSDIYKP